MDAALQNAVVFNERHSFWVWIRNVIEQDTFRFERGIDKNDWIWKTKNRKIDENRDYGKFVVEPLERGYGTTLGNSLRRILLSSLPGAAITNIQIDGVLHEFSTIPGVREDVTQIILNIKGLALKLYAEEEKTLEIDITGPATVTAGDIIVDSDVEILNKDLVICSVAEGATFHARLTVKPGRGYVQADENKKKICQSVYFQLIPSTHPFVVLTTK